MAEADRSLTCPPQTLAPYAEISAHGAPVSPTVQIFKSKLCRPWLSVRHRVASLSNEIVALRLARESPEPTGSYEPTGSEPTGSYLPENARHSRPVKSRSFLKEHPFGATALSRSLNIISVQERNREKRPQTAKVHAFRPNTDSRRHTVSCSTQHCTLSNTTEA
jgi:hypothetical protein